MGRMLIQRSLPGVDPVLGRDEQFELRAGERVFDTNGEYGLSNSICLTYFGSYALRPVGAVGQDQDNATGAFDRHAYRIRSFLARLIMSGEQAWKAGMLKVLGKTVGYGQIGLIVDDVDGVARPFLLSVRRQSVCPLDICLAA
jgi:hypothetical protein